MATRKLDKAQWEAFFDRVSRGLGLKEVSIEVASLAIGDQVQTESAHLKGLTYDPKADAFEVQMENLDHLIPQPGDIFVEETAEGLASVEVIDADQNKQIIKLSSPLLLPVPGTESHAGLRRLTSTVRSWLRGTSRAH